jgi:hypoxanthine phosphoribosyltransferase
MSEPVTNIQLDLDNDWLEAVGPVVFTAEQLEARTVELGSAIRRDYAGMEFMAVGVLRGVLFFMADLVRAIHAPLSMDFIAISRYGPTAQTRGAVRLVKDLDESIEGKHVLFVEDIVDTGLTLGYLLRTMRARNPASLSVCVLFDRPRRRLLDIDTAYVGFEAPENYLVGYGLDYRDRYRNLPYVAVFNPPV